jgi:exoribonuclease-2
VARIAAQAAQEAKKARIIAETSHWIRQVMESDRAPESADKEEIVEILRSFYLFRKTSPHYKLAKEILSSSGLDPKEGPFHLLVKLGVWSEDENLNLHRFGVSHSFASAVTEASERLIREGTRAIPDAGRKDLTHLSILTIDGQGTLDFDDAISIEPKGDAYQLGVHITDVSHFVEKGGLVDQEAFSRASSIYMPDDRIPMLPPTLAEDLFSLKQGQDRLAISIMADLDVSANVLSYEIVPSIIRVKRQLTYYNANLLVQEDPELGAIYEVAQNFRNIRLKNGALQLILPEISIWVDNDGEISVTQINRESPSRMMVSECMIMANWLAARFLRDHGQAAIYRSQLPPRERLIQEGGGTLYENWVQRRFLSRVVLDLDPRPHAGLGLDAYLTLTSPLRKYLDLVTQRQLRGLFGLERSYSEEELRFIIQALEEPMSYITVLQQERTRYWILRYLEALVGHKVEAMVLDKRRQRYIVLLPSYMIECSLPLNSGADLKPQDIIEVKIKQVNARSDTLTLSLA